MSLPVSLPVHERQALHLRGVPGFFFPGDLGDPLQLHSEVQALTPNPRWDRNNYGCGIISAYKNLGFRSIEAKVPAAEFGITEYPI